MKIITYSSSPTEKKLYKTPHLEKLGDIRSTVLGGSPGTGESSGGGGVPRKKKKTTGLTTTGFN